MTSSRDLDQVQELPTDLVLGRYAGLARQIIARRQARRRLLPQGMLVDVAWDLLLQLLATRGQAGAATTDALAAATELSPTVAVRWLSLLQADGMVQFRDQAWELSPGFLNRILAYLRENYAAAA